MIERMQIPGTNSYIYDGSIIILSAYPDVRWISHYGIYVINDTTYNGWYVCEIPTNNKLSLKQSDLVGCIIIYTPEGNPNVEPPEPNVEIPIYINTADLRITDSLVVDGNTVFNGSISANRNKVENVGTPTEETDSATKGYVDDKYAELLEMIATLQQSLNDGR